MADPGAAGPGLARRVTYNTAVQVAGKATVLVIGAGSVAVVTRYLGAEGYGKFALALAFVQMLGVLADIGLLTIVVREISREPGRTRELLANALAIRLVLGAAVVGVAGLLSLVLPYAPDVRVAIVIAGGPFLLGLVTTAIVAVFQARLMMDRVVAAEVAGRVAGLAALVAVVVLDLGFYAVVASTGAGAFVALVVTWTLARRHVRLGVAADRNVWRELAWAALPLGATLAVNEIYFRADTFIISLFRDYDEVGLYSLAYRLIELLALFPAVVMTSVFPLLSRFVGERRELARRTVDAAADVFLATGLPLVLGGLVLAPDIVRLVGGDEFGGSGDPLRLLLVAGSLAALNGLFGYALIAAGRQRDLLRLSLLALAVNLALNVALVPEFGVDAAAATAILSELVIGAGGYLLMRRHLGFYARFGILVPSAAAAGAMAALLWLVSDQPLGLALPLGVLVYAVLLYAFGGVNRGTLEALRG